MLSYLEDQLPELRNVPLLKELRGVLPVTAGDEGRRVGVAAVEGETLKGSIPELARTVLGNRRLQTARSGRGGGCRGTLLGRRGCSAGGGERAHVLRPRLVAAGACGRRSSSGSSSGRSRRGGAGGSRGGSRRLSRRRRLGGLTGSRCGRRLGGLGFALRLYRMCMVRRRGGGGGVRVSAVVKATHLLAPVVRALGLVTLPVLLLTLGVAVLGLWIESVWVCVRVLCSMLTLRHGHGFKRRFCTLRSCCEVPHFEHFDIDWLGIAAVLPGAAVAAAAGVVVAGAAAAPAAAAGAAAVAAAAAAGAAAVAAAVVAGAAAAAGVSAAAATAAPAAGAAAAVAAAAAGATAAAAATAAGVSACGGVAAAATAAGAAAGSASADVADGGVSTAAAAVSTAAAAVAAAGASVAAAVAAAGTAGASAAGAGVGTGVLSVWEREVVVVV